MSRTAAKSGKRARRRRPGRPEGAAHREAVRADLLRAARELFARRDFKATSVRDIAAAARVNPAMIHYHFGDKDGLYRAMLEDTLGPMMHRLQALTEESGNAREAVPLREVLAGVMTTFAREPWLARLIVREVLAEAGPFRDTFIREIAPRAGGRLPKLLGRAIEQGQVRADLDPTLGTLSFMSLVVFPFIALPIAEKVLGIRMTDAFVERLIDHSTRMFYEGAGQKRSQSASR
jgi:TetR/AcrR family transcriptional regulator